MILTRASVALLATLSCVYAQYSTYQYQRPVVQPAPVPRNCGGACTCSPQVYIPFCATDGQQETTYVNKCQFLCAQRQCPNLRVKFEGVCAKPYMHGQGNLNPPSPRPGGYGSQPSWSRPPPSISPPNRYPQFEVGSGRIPRPRTTPTPQRPGYGSSDGFTRTSPRPAYGSSDGFTRTSTLRPAYGSAFGNQEQRYPLTGALTGGQASFRYPPNNNNGGRRVAGYGDGGSRYTRNTDYDDYGSDSEEEL